MVYYRNNRFFEAIIRAYHVQNAVRIVLYHESEQLSRSLPRTPPLTDEGER